MRTYLANHQIKSGAFSFLRHQRVHALLLCAGLCTASASSERLLVEDRKAQETRGANTSQAQQQGRGQSHPLLYVNDGWIYARSIDEKHTVQLVEGEFPTWSPDGSRIIYSDLTSSRLYLFDFRTWRSDELDTNASAASFSPDGRYLALLRPGAHLLLRDLRTHEERTVFDGAAISFAWRDSSNFIFKAKTASFLPCRLFQMSVTSAEPELLHMEMMDFDHSANSHTTAVAGRRFLQWYDHAKEKDLNLIDSDHLEEGDVLVAQRTPAISPDGKKVALTSMWKTSPVTVHSIVIVCDVATKKLRTVVAFDEGALAVNWAPKSDALYVAKYKPVHYSVIDQSGVGTASLTVISLCPKVLNKLKLPKDLSVAELLTRDQLLRYDLNGKSEDIGSGHSLTVFSALKGH